MNWVAISGILAFIIVGTAALLQIKELLAFSRSQRKLSAKQLADELAGLFYSEYKSKEEALANYTKYRQLWTRFNGKDKRSVHYYQALSYGEGIMKYVKAHIPPEELENLDKVEENIEPEQQKQLETPR